MRRVIVGATACLLIVGRLGLVLFALAQQASTDDINRYFHIVTGGVPYRDQAVEYPPVTVGALELIHLAFPGRLTFGVALVLGMALIEALLCVLMWRAFGGGVGIAFLVLDTPLYFLVLTRIDVIAVALTALYVALVLRARTFSAALAWVAAVGAKLWPFPLGSYLFTNSRAPAARRRALVGAATSALVLVGVWLAVGRFEGVRQVLTFRGSHGWQIESLGGSILHALGAGPVYSEGGAMRIGAVPPGLSVAMGLAGAVAAVAACLWAGRQGRPGTGWVTAVMCLLATSTLLSPQFLIWVAPGAAVATRERRPWFIAGVALTLVLTLGVSTYERDLIAGAPFLEALLLMRNVAILCVLAAGLRSLAQRRGAAPRESGSMAADVGGQDGARAAADPAGAPCGGRGPIRRV